MTGQTWHVARGWNEESLADQLNRTQDYTANMRAAATHSDRIHEPLPRGVSEHITTGGHSSNPCDFQEVSSAHVLLVLR